jgi:hypothetical protein
VSFAKYALIAGLTVGAVQLWRNHSHAEFEHRVLAAGDHNGFVPALMPNGAGPGTVLILAAQHCPSAAAKRADDLASRLTRMGIPNTRANQANFSVDQRRQDQVDLMNRTNVIGSGEIPAVFINGMAKANPTADEVAAEYRLSSP